MKKEPTSISLPTPTACYILGNKVKTKKKKTAIV